MSSLMYLVAINKIEEIKELITIENITFNNHSSLVLACKNGNVKIVKLILDYYSEHNINYTNIKNTLILKASNNGHYKVLKLLREYNFDLHIKKDFVFKKACRNGDIDIVEMLIEDIDIKFNQSYCFKWVCKNGFFKVLELLIFHKFEIEKYIEIGMKNAISMNQIIVCEILKREKNKIYFTRYVITEFIRKYSHINK